MLNNNELKKVPILFNLISPAQTEAVKMTILQAISAILIFVSILSLFIIAILGFFLGFLLKEYDKDAYKRIYAFYLPASAFLLNGYVQTVENFEKFSPQKRWILKTLKYVIPGSCIAFILSCFAIYADTL